jgi:uncharacterized protein YbjT (DUF2867 family)
MRVIESVAVIGPSGFVGSGVVRALETKGVRVERIVAPRIENLTRDQAIPFIQSGPPEIISLAAALQPVDAVVNAAGLPDATSGNVPRLVAANGVLPGVIAAASHRAGVRRLIHVSSAAVQGRLPMLDDSGTTDVFSEYSRSKLLGEQMVRMFAPEISVIYRPAGVHGIDRHATWSVTRLARSPFASVAWPGEYPSPQSLIENVGDAIAFLATTTLDPPSVVAHPWEGLTTLDVMQLLGGRAPLMLPKRIAELMIAALRATSRVFPPLSGSVRRVEMLWFGQGQDTSWLSTAGWAPPLGKQAWTELGGKIRCALHQTHSEVVQR